MISTPISSSATNAPPCSPESASLAWHRPERSSGLAAVQTHKPGRRDRLVIHHVADQRGRRAVWNLQLFDLQRMQGASVVVLAVPGGRTWPAPTGSAKIRPALGASRRQSRTI